MGRTIKNRNVSHPKPVQRIVLSESHTRRRGILLILLLITASIAFLYALTSYLKVENGWREIKADASAKSMNCSDEFSFQYELGGGEVPATAEYKAVAALYTKACEKAYQMFNGDVDEINRHPNEVLTVEETLYEAFALIEKFGNRNIYLAPVYGDYKNLFQCKDDTETFSFDPHQNGELREEFKQIADYANDPEAVNLELLGENQVCLRVSEEYENFLSEAGYENYVDFFWMKNAFVADYLADTMAENGYTRGSISSYDGFIRNLDQREQSYGFNIYDRQDQHVYAAAVMEYTGPRSIVSLRNYPMSGMESRNYYELKNGEIRTALADSADGLSKSAINSLVSYSAEMSCAEILLSVIPTYIADEFQESGLDLDGMESVYCKDFVIYHTDEALKMKGLYEKDGVSYTAVAK